MPQITAIVRTIEDGFIKAGKRLRYVAMITLVAACGSRSSYVAAATQSRAPVKGPAADGLAPTVVSVSPGASIEWGFRVAMAGMSETHAQFIDRRISNR